MVEKNAEPGSKAQDKAEDVTQRESLLNKQQSPTAFLEALILPSVKRTALPKPLIRQRKFATVMSLIMLAVSIWELLRFFLEIGALSNSEPEVLVWVILSLLSSLIGITGALILEKWIILLSAIVSCFAVAPMVPRMIILTQGDECPYFVILIILWMVFGMFQSALYGLLNEELKERSRTQVQQAP